MKYLILALSTLTFISCTQQKNVSLDHDEEIGSIFSVVEVQELKKLIKLFDNVVINETYTEGDINEKYHNFCETFNEDETFSNVGTNIWHNNQDSSERLIQKMQTQGLFSEIWRLSKHQQSINKTRLSLNLNGKYLSYLALNSKSSPFISEYLADIQSSGDISPIGVSLMINRAKEMDFANESNRLILAIHYMTVTSKMRSSNQ